MSDQNDIKVKGIYAPEILEFVRSAKDQVAFYRQKIEKTWPHTGIKLDLTASGEIELAFRLEPDNRPHQVYDPVQGKVGLTRWRKLQITDGCTEVEFTPVTGRTHQLRLHAAHELGLGCPIVGDRLYGSGTGPGQLKLHAAQLAFDHPETGERLRFRCDPRFESRTAGP